MRVLAFSGTFKITTPNQETKIKTLQLIEEQRKAYSDERARHDFDEIMMPTKALIRNGDKDTFYIETGRPKVDGYDWAPDKALRTFENAPNLDQQIKTALKKEKIPFIHHDTLLTSYGSTHNGFQRLKRGLFFQNVTYSVSEFLKHLTQAKS